LSVMVLGVALVASTGPLSAQQGFLGPRGIDGGPGANPMALFLEKLDLTVSQHDEVSQIMDRYRDGSLGDQLEAHRKALMGLRELMQNPAADEQQVLAAARAASVVGETLAVEMHRLVVEINSILTAEQRVKLEELRQEWQQTPESRQLGRSPRLGLP